MAGPTATHGVEEVRRAGTGTQAAGSGHHPGRAGHDRDTGSECIVPLQYHGNVRSRVIIIVRAIVIDEFDRISRINYAGRVNLKFFK